MSKLEDIKRHAEADRIHYATGNSYPLNGTKDREALLAALDAVLALVDKAYAEPTYVLPGGYPSRPVEAFDLRNAINNALEG